MENKDSNLKGVGGWLLFFVIVITIINPIKFLFDFVNTFIRYKKFYEPNPELMHQFGLSWQAFYTSNLVNFILLAIGFWAGVLLWKKKESGVRLTYFYLITSIVFAIIFSIRGILNPPQNPLESSLLIPSIISGILIVLVWNLVWLFYFKKSKRVKNTYY